MCKKPTVQNVSKYSNKQSHSSSYKYTANVYRQMTDELMFKSVISTQRWNQKIVYSRMCYQQEKYIDNYFEVCFLSKECTQ